MTLIYLLAGEQSGDVLGGRLMAALRARRPDLQFAGVGGPRMTGEGLQSLFPMHELAVMGLVEILPRLRRLRRLLLQARADIARVQPDIVVTIDSPGFTLRLLRLIAPLGLKRVHYVAPQVWAWREHRVREFPGLWDRLLCLLPFEPEFFASHGLPASFVGHPVLESGADRGDAARFRARFRLDEQSQIVILMPGSRRTEIPRLLPVFARTMQRLTERLPQVVPVLPVASAVASQVERAVQTWPRRPVIVTDLTDKHDAFAAASAALTKSGTSTLELALAGVPMAVTYRVNRLTGAIARRLIRVPHVAMVNLLAKQRLVPELLQQDCNPARLSDTLFTLLTDAEAAQTQRAGFQSLLQSLRPPNGTPSCAATGSRPQRTFATRLPSISNTSNRQPPNTIRSPDCGTRRSRASNKPASV
jgi:lipid-A-disaccharide synthase